MYGPMMNCTLANVLQSFLFGQHTQQTRDVHSMPVQCWPTSATPGIFLFHNFQHVSTAYQYFCVFFPVAVHAVAVLVGFYGMRIVVDNVVGHVSQRDL